MSTHCPRRFVDVWQCVVGLFPLIILVAGVSGCGGSSRPSATLPAWAPEETQAAKLDPPTELFLSYQIRLPPDWHFRDRSAGDSFSRSWDDLPTRFNPGNLRSLHVSIAAPQSAEEQKKPLPDFMADWRKGPVSAAEHLRELKDASVTPPESGLVNGITFARCRGRWGFLIAGVEGTQTVQGILYVARHNNRLIFLEAVAAGKEAEDHLKLMEAAILTFRSAGSSPSR